MSLIDILMYFTRSFFIILVLLFTYYSLQNAKLMKGSKGRQVMAAGAMLFLVASVIGTVDAFFFPGNGLHLSVFFVWMVALSTLIYGGVLVGNAIQKVYPHSLLKIAWEHPGSIYDLIGLSVLVLCGIPVYLLDILRPPSGELSWYSVFNVAIWSFCFANLFFAARTHCRSVVKRGEEHKEVALLRGDVLAARAYGTLINTFLAVAKPFAHLIKEALLEYFEYNPILFESCEVKRDGTVDFEPLVRNIDRIHGKNRIPEICVMFSALSSKLLELYGAVTSPQHAEEVLARSYRATREGYGDSTVFYDILRSLPKGVLEEQKLALLPREELEERVQQRTAQLCETKAKLERAKDYTDNIIKSMADTLIVVNPDVTIKAVNQATLDLLGYQENEMIGKPIRIITGEEVSLFRGSGLGDDLIKEGFVRNVEKTYLSKDGRKIPVLFSGSVMRDDGKIQGIICVARDITERKKAEETLIRSEKLRVLGEMAAGVAHDFNNLLAIILGNAQLLERGLKRYKAEEIKHRLKMIARTAEEGGKTVTRLQHFTRREVSFQDFTGIDLNKIVRSAVRSTSPRWKDEAEAKGTTIRIKEKLGKLPPILGSRSELMEVLTNLIFNALEAMPEGGEITIRTEAKGNEVYLYFTDSGQGIPDSIKGKIFDPFFTTKGPQASGLGLSICYGIIKRHQGKIKVESRKGKETTFTISIPVGLETALKEEKLKEPPKISSRKILVIDDEEGIREVLEEILKDEGHRVTLAETSRKGLEKFKQSDFDLVLTDLGMPEMSGWELAKKIKEIDSGIPVGLITGWGVATTKEKMKEAGVDFILSKPFNYTKVVRELKAVLKSKIDSYPS